MRIEWFFGFVLLILGCPQLRGGELDDTLFQLIRENKSLSEITKLLDAGANPSAIKRNETEVVSPIFEAARKGRWDVVKVLVSRGGKLTEFTNENNNENSYSILAEFDLMNQLEIARLLYDAQSKATAFRFPDFQAQLNGKSALTVEKILKDLPENFKKRSVLAFHSRSSQPASYDQPRVILFNQYADFVMALHPDSRNVETIDFDYATKSFNFRELSLETGQFSETNPVQCANCHKKGGIRGGLRPNWDPYFVWRGFFGSVDDNLSHPGKEEADGTKRFLKSGSKSGIYRYLPDLYSRFTNTHEGVRPNLQFTQQILLRNYERIIGEIMQSRYYSELKPILLYLMVCRAPVDDPYAYPPAAVVGDRAQKYFARLDESRKEKSDLIWPKGEVPYSLLVAYDSVFESNVTDGGHIGENFPTAFKLEKFDFGPFSRSNGLQIDSFARYMGVFDPDLAQFYGKYRFDCHKLAHAWEPALIAYEKKREAEASTTHTPSKRNSPAATQPPKPQHPSGP